MHNNKSPQHFFIWEKKRILRHWWIKIWREYLNGRRWNGKVYDNKKIEYEIKDEKGM